MSEANSVKKILPLLIFALAMGYLEATVVVYLREIFYPEGFIFPIKLIPLDLAAIEIGREAATVCMLLAAAFIAERTRRGRFACFMLLFGFWDLAYYLWLYVMVSWPPSMLTWDLLFLIPVIWTGPVLAPVIVSALMIAAALVYYSDTRAAEEVMIPKLDWLLTILAGGVIFVSFALNHRVAYEGGVPTRFAWEIFASGVALAIFVLVRVGRRLTYPR
jgi:hypothetical protein